jgi:nucleoside-diphosphate-sugar epimerase
LKQSIAILGCGWLGMPLGESLVKLGYSVNGSTTRTEKLSIIQEKGMNAFLLKAGDTLEGQHIQSFLDADVLLINIPPGARRDPNVLHTYPHKIAVILEAAAQSPIQQLIFVSSTGVYPNNNGTVDEATPPEPLTASGQAVLAAEEKCLAHALPTTILRMAGLVGGGRKAGRFFAGKKDIPNGGAPVNLVHLTDCIHIIEELLAQKVKEGIFNVCSDKHPSRAQFYTLQAEKSGFEAPVFRMDTSSYKVVSNQKIKSVLDYSFQYPEPMDFPV